MDEIEGLGGVLIFGTMLITWICLHLTDEGD